VKIALLKAGVEVGIINASTSIGSGGTGSYMWKINPVGATGSDYKVKVQSISQPTIFDTSNNYFTITPATSSTITVTSPNGGETWQRGTSRKVTWSYTGTPGSIVKIVLFKRETEIGTIAASTSIGSGGTGSFTWNINPTGSYGGDYKVKISSINKPTISDISNNYFTLLSASTKPFISSVTGDSVCMDLYDPEPFTILGEGFQSDAKVYLSDPLCSGGFQVCPPIYYATDVKTTRSDRITCTINAYEVNGLYYGYKYNLNVLNPSGTWAQKINAVYVVPCDM
jgi:hypothetical protein